jgi:DNA polymerase-3 subunit alpha
LNEQVCLPKGRHTFFPFWVEAPVFVHLHCHSYYSFLRGVASPEEIVAAAVEQKMPAVALTDTNGLYAAVPFYQAARKAGVTPIVGVTLDFEFRTSNFVPRGSKNETQNPLSTPLVLLATNMEGYSNLCQLVTLRHLGAANLSQNTDAAENDEDRPVTIEELAEHSNGVIALCPITSTPLNIGNRKDATRCDPVRGKKCVAHLKDIFGERLWIEVHQLSPGDGRALRDAQQIGRETGIPLVATNNVHFLQPEEHLHHRAVNAIRTGGLLTTVALPEITTGEAWFKPAVEMQKLFPDYPELLQATLEIAERCNLQLELGKFIFPEFPVPENETPDSHLQKLCFEGIRRLYGGREQEALPRLKHELEVIKKRHLAPYFLLVWDIVKEARRRCIPAVARGSAASSIVTYCLGISRVCPLRWGLYFELFLNVERGDCPDIDIDICGARRDEMLDYVYARWGEAHVAMIGSFVTMHARLAIREAAKVFGVPPQEVNHFTKRLPHRPVSEILQAIRDLPECRSLPVNDEPWKTILKVALRLDNAPRHTGIHPCGTVISAQPLTRLAPLERATKGIVVTQYDMDAIEALGLIKMDLLGQRGFTTMSLALDNIEKSRTGIPACLAVHKPKPRKRTDKNVCPTARAIDFDAIPENDPATCDMIAAGRTMGIFQIESPAMRGLLRAMKARTLEEISMALALIRPGAAEYGSKELFVRRLRKQEEVGYAHESLRKILDDSLGVCIYQEQVMQIAQAIGNMSLAEADLIRRSSGKFSGRRDQKRLRGEFLKAAGIMGLTKAQRKETWMMVEKFGAFGFCKAHSATYADISYRMAYLKAHHTAEFLAAMCSASAGFYHVSAYVEEAKRWGIAVRLPSVNHSRMEYTVEAGENGEQALRVGLMQVGGLRVETIIAIVRSREHDGAYCSLEDFLQRIPVDRDEIEALIKCGAFDDICAMTRPEMLWHWSFLQADKSAQARASVPIGVGQAFLPVIFSTEGKNGQTRMSVPQYTLEQKLHYEREILEVCVSGHPLDFLPRNGEVWSDELPRLQGKRVTLCGWVVTYRHVGTKNYRNMMFVTLEDQRGVYEVVLFPDAYDRYGGLVFETHSMRVTGRVEPDGQIKGEMLEALEK